MLFARNLHVLKSTVITNALNWFLPLVLMAVLKDVFWENYSPQQEKYRTFPGALYLLLFFSGAVYLLCYFITKALISILRSWIPLELEMARTWANRSTFLHSSCVVTTDYFCTTPGLIEQCSPETSDFPRGQVGYLTYALRQGFSPKCWFYFLDF